MSIKPGRGMSGNKYGIQLKSGIAILIVALIYFLSVVVLFHQLTGSVQERTNESYQSLMHVYTNQLMLEFEEVEKYVNTLSLDFDMNMLALEDPDTDAYQLRRYQIRNKIFSYYYNYRVLTGFYLYDSGLDLMTYIPDDKGHYAEFVRSYVAETGKPNGWYRFYLEDKAEYAFARTCRLSETQWLFAFVSLSGIEEEFGDIAEGSGLLWDIEDPKGNILCGSVELLENEPGGNAYDVISEQLTYSTVELVFHLYVGSDVMWEQNRIYIVFFAASLVVFSVFVIGVVWYMRRSMLSPLQQLLDGMARFAGGDDQVQIGEMRGVEPEMLYALQSFNHMVEEIRENRFSIYEAKLEQQKLLIQNMQSQINPHFFSNTTNLIYNLLEIGRIDTAEQCLMLLSSYYRYMTTIGQEYTTLKQEMDFVDSYLEIMKLRFPNKFSCEMQLAEELEGMQIPPLLIQPLAENCVKHGFTDRKRSFHVAIRVYVQEDAAVIDVVDNGKGFPEEYRGCFDSVTPMPEREQKENEENHVGMQNIYQRLMMQYGERASMRIDWTGQSTLVQIRIMLQENTCNRVP